MLKMSNLFQKNILDAEVSGGDILLQSSGKPLLKESTQLVADLQHDKADLTVFFGIGMIVNIVMIVSFFIWAVKQWKKNDTTKK